MTKMIVQANAKEVHCRQQAFISCGLMGLRSMLDFWLDDHVYGLSLHTMKINSCLPCAMTLLLLACSFFQGSNAVWAQSPGAPAESAGQTMRAGVAKVVGGEVRVLGAKGMRPLEPGDEVFSGDRIISGRYGLASVVLRDGTTLVLGNNSQLQIQKFAFNATTADGNMLVELLQGSVRLLTGLMSKINPDAVQVKSGTLLIGVRGTDFIVEAEAPFFFFPF